MTQENPSLPIITAAELLQHWQGHRRLTRKTIEKFPDDQLFQFSLGGMRPFGAMVQELLGMALPVVEGVRTGQWEMPSRATPANKAELLRAWDEQTRALGESFARIPAPRFRAVDKAFGQWESENLKTLQYAIDNEIHHRGQAYVYLRALGIEPPPFWERN